MKNYKSYFLSLMVGLVSLPMAQSMDQPNADNPHSNHINTQCGGNLQEVSNDQEEIFMINTASNQGLSRSNNNEDEDIRAQFTIISDEIQRSGSVEMMNNFKSLVGFKPSNRQIQKEAIVWYTQLVSNTTSSQSSLPNHPDIAQEGDHGAPPEQAQQTTLDNPLVPSHEQYKANHTKFQLGKINSKYLIVENLWLGYGFNIKEILWKSSPKNRQILIENSELIETLIEKKRVEIKNKLDKMLNLITNYRTAEEGMTEWDKLLLKEITTIPGVMKQKIQAGFTVYNEVLRYLYHFLAKSNLVIYLQNHNGRNRVIKENKEKSSLLIMSILKNIQQDPIDINQRAFVFPPAKKPVNFLHLAVGFHLPTVVDKLLTMGADPSICLNCNIAEWKQQIRHIFSLAHTGFFNIGTFSSEPKQKK